MPVQQRVTMPGMQVLIHHRAVALAPGLIVFESHTTTVHTAPDKLFRLCLPRPALVRGRCLGWPHNRTGARKG